MPSSDAFYSRSESRIADLSGRAKLRLTGADRVRYLNGQVTANVTRLGPDDPALPACVTTPKGKLCADVFVTATADALLIDAEPELRESLVARLDRYIVSDDAAIEDVTDSLALFHLLPRVEGVFAFHSRQTGDSAEARAFVAPHSANRYGTPGWDYFGPAEHAASTLETFTSIDPLNLRRLPFVSIDSEALEILRIEHGVPRWGRELGEDTLPPEAGLDRTHVDYHKGCYIGQEVVSRLKSVGHVNRQLLGFTDCGNSGRLAAGLHLYSPADETKPVGQLTSAAYSEALGKSIALGYLRRGASTAGLLARLPSHSPASAFSVYVQDLPFLP